MVHGERRFASIHSGLAGLRDGGRVVDEHIEPVMALADLLGQRADRGLRRQVTEEVLHSIRSGGPPYLFGRRLHRRSRSQATRPTCARPGPGRCWSPAYAPVGAGHETDLSGRSGRQVVLSWSMTTVIPLAVPIWCRRGENRRARVQHGHGDHRRVQVVSGPPGGVEGIVTDCRAQRADPIDVLIVGGRRRAEPVGA